MAKKLKSKAKPGSSATRKVTRGPNKGDTVTFVANKAGTMHPGKLVPRRVIKDVGAKNVTGLAKGKKNKAKKRKGPTFS